MKSKILVPIAMPVVVVTVLVTMIWVISGHRVDQIVERVADEVVERMAAELETRVKQGG